MPKKNSLNLYTVFSLAIAILLPTLIIPIMANPLVGSKSLLLFTLGFGTLLIYLFKSLSEKKWLFSAQPLVLPLILFGGSILLSSVVTHQYPFQQLVGWGGIFLAVMTTILFAPTLLKAETAKKFIQVLNVAGLILVLGSVLQLFGIGYAQIINQLGIFEFANNLSFSLTGSPFISVQLLSILVLANIFSKEQRQSVGQKIIIALLMLGLGINLYAIMPGQVANFKVLPLSAGVAVARQSLAVSRTALFGYGPANYSNAFNLLKPMWINSTEFWQYAFDSASAFPLTLIVSGGLLALLSWIFLASRSIKIVTAKKDHQADALRYIILGSLVWQFFAPINVVMLGVFALAISFYLAANLGDYKIKKFSFNSIFDPFNLRPENKANAYTFTTLSVIAVAIVFFLGYQVVVNYVAQFVSYQANAAAANNDFNKAFAKQERARNLASRSDAFRRTYALSNLEIAIAMSNKTDITATEQEQVLTLVNNAITEAKAATILEPQSYQNWLALAEIYIQLIDVTEEAKQQAFDALAQAAVMSPNDPSLRMRLGQLFFQLEQWPNAVTFFGQAVERKPDMLTAYYALAQALIKNEQIIEAEAALKQTLTLIDKEQNLEDYTKVEEELKVITQQADELRAKIAAQQAQQAQAQQQAQQQGQDQAAPTGTPAATPAAEGESGLGNLLDEQATEDMLLNENLATEAETLQ